MRKLLGLAGALLAWVAPPAASAQTGVSLMMTGANANQLTALDPATGAYMFGTPSLRSMGNEDGNQIQGPAGYAWTPTLKYESYARFASDVDNGRIDPAIRTVKYDPENWSATPAPEKRDPERYFRLFVEKAGAAGFAEVGLAPSRDIVSYWNALCRKRQGEKLSDAYLRCRIAEKGARANPDFFQVQSQVLEDDPAEFRRFIADARSQVLGVDPATRVWGGLSTSPYNYVATSETLYNAFRSAYPALVSGWYFTINAEERANVALPFLQQLRAEGF